MTADSHGGGEPAVIAIDLCPACLIELRAGYPYDHVRIDRALAGNAGLFRSMDSDEQREVVRTGRDRGLSVTALGVRLAKSTTDIHNLLGEPTPARAPRQEELDSKVRDLWSRELSDSDIALRIGIHPGTVAKKRHHLGLPALFGPGGRRKEVGS